MTVSGIRQILVVALTPLLTGNHLFLCALLECTPFKLEGRISYSKATGKGTWGNEPKEVVKRGKGNNRP